jgi:hypothetical protein
MFQWRGERIDDCNTLAFQKAVKAAKVGRCAGTICAIPGGSQNSAKTSHKNRHTQK